MTTYKELINSIKSDLKLEIESYKIWKQLNKQFQRDLNTRQQEIENNIPKEASSLSQEFIHALTHYGVDDYITKQAKEQMADYHPYNYIEHRGRHIAYCLFRGKTIEQIEPHRKEWNQDQHKRADYYSRRFLTEWRTAAAEDIAAYEAKKAERKAASGE